MTACIKYAYALNGPEAGQRLEHGHLVEVLRADQLGWVHLDATDPEAPDWIAHNLPYLDPAVHESLTVTATRSRATRIGDGMLVVLRGVNMNEGRDPEDMVAVRMWVDENRIVTLSRQRVRALEDICNALDTGQGPETAGAFLDMLAERLNARLEPLVMELDTETDGLETQVIGDPDQSLRKRIVAMRLQVIEFYRHCSPQVQALRAVEEAAPPFLAETDRLGLAETRQSLTRQVENLAEMRDSLAVLREELSGQISDRLNRHMYFLSIISAIFLPLGFLTGLLGINVGGMPGASSPIAFWLVCGGLSTVVLAQLMVLRRARWL
ncbi:zinc transporter ZntB [Pseudooceanicola nanhaiensis]|uniref:zinc transporter ZntB n=1 Tax=Pseudooceanicola nanhaiensis TaxID=375761 RepID=UPI001CD495FA|nr:zinc transporter ZntB [Pseudooceanicola nanhaiensis]MCA0923008.1 zinc transporter ZntB [Pseudooceanicola nanhaiensis]